MWCIYIWCTSTVHLNYGNTVPWTLCRIYSRQCHWCTITHNSYMQGMHYYVLWCSCPCTVGDRWRVLLRGEAENYIHAVAVNVRKWKFCSYLPAILRQVPISIQGYKQKRAFIIAQSPMPSTARDFLKMIIDRKCGVIVMLCDVMEAGQVGWRTQYSCCGFHVP